MGIFSRHEAKEAHDQVYGGATPHAELSHELLSGAAGFEAMRIYEHHELGKELVAGFAAAEVDKHFEKGGFGHLDREQARQQAQQQATDLYDKQYS
jgi:hypothetical protein